LGHQHDVHLATAIRRRVVLVVPQRDGYEGRHDGQGDADS
jgi:hypothetical protein